MYVCVLGWRQVTTCLSLLWSFFSFAFLAMSAKGTENTKENAWNCPLVAGWLKCMLASWSVEWFSPRLACDVCGFVWGSGLCLGKRVCVYISVCVKAGQRVKSGLRKQTLPDWPHAQAEHSSCDQETHQIVNCHNQDQHSQHYTNYGPCYHAGLNRNWERKRNIEGKVGTVKVSGLQTSCTDVLCPSFKATVLHCGKVYRCNYFTKMTPMHHQSMST